MNMITKKKTVPLIEPNNLFSCINCNEIPIIISKWIVRSYQSYLVTGDMGTGKSTYIKSIARYYPINAPIRTSEIRPELNLRFAYPDRNIVSFFETNKMSVQDGLDFQKKTSGLVSIIGEIANAQAASWWIQTTKVAFRSGAGTFHGKTIDDTITGLRDNIAQVSHFTDINAVEVMVADALDFDIHMCREDKLRYNERITEVLPVKQREYPYPNYHNVQKEDMKMALDTNNLEYFRRMTDRKNYEAKNICEYDKEAQRYVFTHMFSESVIANMKKNLSKSDYERFEKDMDKLLTYNRGA